MNRIYSLLTYILTATAMVLLASSCEDRIDYPGYEDFKEGVSAVQLQVGYQAFTPALEDSRSGGRDIENIDQLWVVIYYTDGTLFRKVKIDESTEGVTDVEYTKDYDQGDPHEDKLTGHVSFKLLMPHGRYRMYAVGNYDLGAIANSDLDGYDDGGTWVNGWDKLKSLSLTWDKAAASNNAQMFGWFVNGDRDTKWDYADAPLVVVRDKNTTLHSWVKRAASKLTIAFNTVNLNEGVYIYLKSVTVKDIPTECYLGKDNNVGDDAYMAAHPGKTRKDLLTDGETIYFSGAKAEHVGQEDHGDWPRIASGDSIFGLVTDQGGDPAKAKMRGKTLEERLANEHSIDAPALYFYENMQPNGEEGTMSDKRQDVSGENKQVSYEDGVKPSTAPDAQDQDVNNVGPWKDARPWGSYVEIKAYYENNSDRRPGKGDIIYRFMLGKDVKTNYEAERNHHYKLTLKFTGEANDIDFHIDYEEEARPGFFVQDTTYVSYLYNQPAHTMVRATPKPGYSLMSMEALIINNEWRPYSTGRDDNPPMDKGEDKETLSLYYRDAWDAMVNGENNDYGSYAFDNVNYPQQSLSYTDYSGKTTTINARRYCEYGFLSLRKSTTITKEYDGNGDKSHKQKLIEGIRDFYYHTQAPNTGPAYRRSYTDFPKTDTSEEGVALGDENDAQYIVSRKTDTKLNTVDYVIQVPFYTRSKTIDSWAVFSGANPFYKHRRYARVMFVAHYEKTDPNVEGPDKYDDVGYTQVKQAFRIDNPRGIYRKHNRLEEFHVRMAHSTLNAREIMEKEQHGTIGDGDVVFAPIISRGAWKAVIEKDDHNFISIYTNNQKVTKVGDAIYGRTGTPVEFTYKPTTAAPKGESWGGVITIYYHNNSCIHKIIVKQGYAPVRLDYLSPTHELWSSFNLFNHNELCKSPLEIGSFYCRYETPNFPILPENNSTYRVNVIPGDSVLLTEDAVNGKRIIKWTAIGSQTNKNFTDAFNKDMEFLEPVNGKEYTFRLPQKEEMLNLGIYLTKDSDPQQTEIDQCQDLNQAFGICYADGARTTRLTHDAYTFEDPYNEGKLDPRGVRGVVIYSHYDGNNIFFPFGAYGHGRRKGRVADTNWDSKRMAYGMMHYGSLEYKLTGNANKFRPLAYDLPAQSGACYWINSSENASPKGGYGTKERIPIAIDFNGGNYMASWLWYDDLTSDTQGWTFDALPIKPIYPDDWVAE